MKSSELNFEMNLSISKNVDLSSLYELADAVESAYRGLSDLMGESESLGFGDAVDRYVSQGQKLNELVLEQKELKRQLAELSSRIKDAKHSLSQLAVGFDSKCKQHLNTLIKVREEFAEKFDEAKEIGLITNDLPVLKSLRNFDFLCTK